jgi:hypothetical protein
MNTLKKSEDPGHLAITSSPSLKIILSTGTGAAAYTQIQELQYGTYLYSTRAANTDPHYFWKINPDPHSREKLDPDPH